MPRFGLTARRMMAAVANVAFSPLSTQKLCVIARRARIAMGGEVGHLTRFRFTIRGMMIGAAIAALGLWGVKMRQASANYQVRAEIYRAQLAVSQLPVPPSVPHFSRRVTEEERSAALAAFNKDQATAWAEIESRRRPRKRYLERMVAKYEHASRFPWLAVAPDPPEPQ